MALARVLADSLGIPSGPMRLKLLMDKTGGKCTKLDEDELPSRPINVRWFLSVEVLRVRVLR